MLRRMTFLRAAENRESFFRRIKLFFPPLDPRYKAIERAYQCAKDAFREKLREDGGQYFEHLRAVALIQIDYLRLTDYELIIAGLLHDIVEDIPSWNIERVQKEFGERVAYFVQYATKPSKKEYPNEKDRNRLYHLRLRLAPREFFLVKLPDRLHNILTLDACPREKQIRKVEETYRYYMPYAEQHFILVHALEEALERIERKLKLKRKR